MRFSLSSVCLLLLLPMSLFAGVLSIVPNALTKSVIAGETVTVEYTVTNTASNQAAIPGPFVVTPGNQAHIALSETTPSNTPACSTLGTGNLVYGSSCYFSLQITGMSATTTDVLVRPKVCAFHGTGPCDVALASNAVHVAVAPSGIGGRTFTIKNECPFRVSFGFVSGSVQSPLIPSSGGQACSKTQPCASPQVCAYANSSASSGICSPMKDIFCNPNYYNKHAAECTGHGRTQVCGVCPSGSSCKADAGNIIDNVTTGLCFTTAPEVTSPVSGSHVLAAGSQAEPTEATARLIPSLTTVDVKWSGGVFPRIIPQAGNATTIAGWCRSDKDATKPCDLGTGPQPPYTGAEFTLLRSSQDTYDVTMIDGPTIPVSMQPSTIDRDSANAYLCGTPGATNPQASTDYTLNSSTWQFTNPDGDVGYNFVHLTAESVACTTANASSVCTGTSVGGTSCGIGYQPGTTTVTGPKCGTLLGHWTGAKACSYDYAYFNNLFSCKEPYDGATNFDLYKCTGVAPVSCYTTGATTSCCGCSNWGGIATPTTQCNAQNPTWLASTIYDNISYLKQGSPTSYSYPYDDKSSTFTCPATNTSAKVGAVDYTVTFCPSNTTSGITPPVN
jgi:hypothetical protein